MEGGRARDGGGEGVMEEGENGRRWREQKEKKMGGRGRDNKGHKVF